MIGGVVMKKRRVIVCLIVILCLAAIIIVLIKMLGHKSGNTSYMIDSFSGEIIENSVTGLSFENNRLTFEYSGRTYTFDVEPFVPSETNSAQDVRYFSGQKDTMACNIAEYENSFCAQIIDTSQSAAARQQDRLHNFTLVWSEDGDVDIESITEFFNQAGLTAE